METKLNYKRTFLIGLAFLSICSFWQMYDNIIPLILQNTYHLGETMTGAVMACCSEPSCLPSSENRVTLLPVFGALSDKVHTKLGRRMPFIVAGTILAVIFMMLLPMIDNAEKARWNTGESFSNQVIFLAVLFFTLVSMGLYRSPAVALMPDVTPNHLRSRANAVINLMGAVGGVYALIMIKVLVGKGETPDYLPLFASIAAVMAIAVGILVITIRENKLREEVEKAANAGTIEEKAMAEGVEAAGEIEAVGDTGEVKSFDGKKQTGKTEGTKGMPKEVKRSMYFMLASIFLWFTAYNAVTTAFSRYTKVVWKMEGGSFANCLMVATVAAILSYIPIGNISAKIGRKKTIMGGVLLMAACYGGAIFAREYHPIVNVAFALIGVAWAAINVNSYPMIVAMSSGSDVGKFTGTYYTFSMAAQILTPVLSGFLLENVSYNTLFPYALFFSLMAFLTMTQVRHGDVKPQKKESILENFDVDD